MPKWALHIDIYEAAVGDAYPIIIHTFLGRTKAEAQGYYESHLKTDEFLRGCVKRGRWQSVECWAETHWEHL